eukprot:827000-Amphidinium_carterae.1
MRRASVILLSRCRECPWNRTRKGQQVLGNGFREQSSVTVFPSIDPSLNIEKSLSVSKAQVKYMLVVFASSISLSLTPLPFELESVDIAI